MPTSTDAATQLRAILRASAILVGHDKLPPSSLTDSSRSSLAGLLKARQDGFQQVVAEARCKKAFASPATLEYTGSDGSDERHYKLVTARLALLCLQELSKLSISQRNAPSTSSAPLAQAPIFGLKDVKILQLLCGLTTRWGVALLLPRGILPAALQDKEERVTELPTDREQMQENDLLYFLVQGSASVLLPEEIGGGHGSDGSELQRITFPGLFVHTLAGLLYYKHEKGEQASVHQKTKSRAEDVLESLLNTPNPSTSLATLLTFLSSASTQANKPAWLTTAVSSLLSRQLIRPGGILGLLNVLIGKQDKELQISQLEQVARVLTTPPAGMKAEVYLGAILPRLIDLLQSPKSAAQQALPAAYIRALAFCISRLIRTQPVLLAAVLYQQYAFTVSTTQDAAPDIEGQLEFLSVLIRNIDPAPTNYAFLLPQDTVVKLFSIWLFVSETRGDPVLKGLVEDLLKTWGRTLADDQIINGLLKVVESADGYKWDRTAAGGVAPRQDSSSSLPGDEGLLAPSFEKGEDVLALRPDPALLVDYLRKVARPQVTITLLTSWLDQIHLLRAIPAAASSFETQKEILLKLQLILGIIEAEGSEFVAKFPEEMLVFIDHALTGPEGGEDSGWSERESRSEVLGGRRDRKGKGRAHRPNKGKGLSMADLKIVTSDSESDDEGDRSVGEDEAEFPELAGIGKDNELVVTGLTLLLSILEGNESMSFSDNLLLQKIYAKLEILSEHSSSTVARLARDAKLVLSSRKLAATAVHSSMGSTKIAPGVSAGAETYREALKLLQDPILPVRAQGLSLLRSLVTSSSSLDGQASFVKTDPALLPGILDIFVQSIQDEDSFIYLNAVQGLAAIVECYPKPTLARLTTIYLGRDEQSVGEGDKGRRELDVRLRAGEALSQVIQKAGNALPAYGESALLPALLHVLRTTSLPVALRASSLTILSTWAETSPLSLLPQSRALLDACLDLLSLESGKVQSAPFKGIQEVERENGQVKVDETPDGLEASAGHPSLRRGAIFFLTQLIRGAAEKDAALELAGREVGRFKAVVGYVKATDADALTRHNAGVLLDDVEDLY